MTKEMTPADFELRPEFGLLAGEFPSLNTRPGYGYDGVPMHFRVFVDEYPLSTYTNVGLFVVTTDPEGESSVLIEESMDLDPTMPGAESDLFMLEGLPIGSVTHFYITADELIVEEVMQPFHFHTVLTGPGPAVRLQVYSPEEIAAEIGGESCLIPDDWDDVIGGMSYLECAPGESRLIFVRAFDSEDRIVTNQPFRFGIENASVTMNSLYAVEDQPEEMAFQVMSDPHKITLFSWTEAAIPVNIVIDLEAEAVDDIDLWGELHPGVDVTTLEEEAFQTLAVLAIADSTGLNPAPFRIANNAGLAPAVITSGAVIMESQYDPIISGHRALNEGLNRVIPWAYYGPDQTIQPAVTFTFDPTVPSGSSAFSLPANTYIQWVITTGGSVSQSEVTTDTTGHSVTWVPPHDPGPTTGPSWARWAISTFIMDSTTTPHTVMWRQYKVFHTCDRVILPVYATQFGGGTGWNQGHWDAAFERINDIYMGSAIAFDMPSGVDFASGSSAPEIETTYTPAFIELKSTALGQLISEWETAYPGTVPETSGGTAWNLARPPFPLGLQYPATSSAPDLVDMVENTSALQGALNRITVLGNTRTFVQPNMQGPLVNAAIGNHLLTSQWQRNVVPIYDVFGIWANVVVLNDNSLTGTKSTLGHEFGHVVGLPHPPHGWAPTSMNLDELLMFETRPNNSANWLLPHDKLYARLGADKIRLGQK